MDLRGALRAKEKLPASGAQLGGLIDWPVIAIGRVVLTSSAPVGALMPMPTDPVTREGMAGFESQYSAWSDMSPSPDASNWKSWWDVGPEDEGSATAAEPTANGTVRSRLKRLLRP